MYQHSEHHKKIINEGIKRRRELYRAKKAKEKTMTAIDQFATMNLAEQGEYLEGLDTPSLIKFIVAWVDLGHHKKQPDVMLSVAQHLDIG